MRHDTEDSVVVRGGYERLPDGNVLTALLQIFVSAVLFGVSFV